MIVRALDLLHNTSCLHQSVSTQHVMEQGQTITPNYINSHFVITALHLLKQQEDIASQLQQFISL